LGFAGGVAQIGETWVRAPTAEWRGCPTPDAIIIESPTAGNGNA
jgi:hypothetical protein